MNNYCQLCGSTENLTKHHLIPQVKSKKKKFKEIKEDTICICSVCHTTIHAYFTENELRDSLNTIKSLLNNEKFSKYIQWRKKHLIFKSNSTKLSK